MNIVFHQRSDEQFRSPWPVVVDEKSNIVSGRPDASYLVGFASAEDVYSVAVLPEAVQADPNVAVGMVPVFGKDGKFFAIDLPITQCREYEGDIEKLRELGK